MKRESILRQGRFSGLLLAILAALLCAPSARAQDVSAPESRTLSVQACLDIAMKRNLELKQMRLNEEISGARYDQTWYNYLPSANANVNFQRNFGTTFNPVSFSRSNVRTDFSSPSLNFNWTLFNGFSNRRERAASYERLLAARYGAERVANSILLNVLLAYMQIIFDQGNIDAQQARMDVLRAQLERVDKRIAAGAAVRADRLNLQSQLASEELTLVNLQNQFEQDKANLLQLLQLPILDSYVFEEPLSARPGAGLEDLGDEPEPVSEIMQSAELTMPEIKEQRRNVAAAEFDVKQAQSALYPTLSLNVNLSSQYTSQTNSFFFEPERTGYFQQMQDAFQQSVGLRLTIPIFNNLQTRTNLEVAELNLLAAKITQEQTSLNLRQEVQRAYLDVALARKRYDAAAAQLEAVELSLDNARKSYEAGAMDFYAFNEILNNKTQVEVELLQARYDYYFKRKTLDVYQGKKLEF